MAAINNKALTKYAAILSATSTIFGFSAAACSIKATISDKRVCLPTALILIINGDSPWTEPPTTKSPTFLAIGRLSPVNKLSSAEDLPSKISPSAGMLSPGFTNTTSSTESSEVIQRCRLRFSADFSEK